MIFRAGDNCWRVERAERASLLIDGQCYFEALFEAMGQARHSIVVIGWDLHSGVRLVRSGTPSEAPVELGAYLDYLVRRRDRLEVYLLSWDFAMIYALEREFFPRYKLKWRTHDRIHFCLDGAHPVGGSQHQKLVVIDGALAFAGGLDISKWRWDTPAHNRDEQGRVDPDGNPYPPFHDVQALVDGQAAEALAELAADRWRQATGTTLELVVGGDTASWPAGVKADFSAVRTAIARTLPAYQGRPEVREVEQLFLDSIEAARKWIYIENQYLSSHRLGEALAARLEQEDGPEIVIVMPRRTGGWLEQHTMDLLRGRVLQKLRDAVHSQERLRVVYPRLSKNPETELMVHAKVMVVDDWLLRVGSANLSNRSFGLDSECDLAFEGRPGSQASATIRGFRDGLLGEHLDCPSGEIAAEIERTGSLIAALDRLRGGDRTLVNLGGELSDDLDRQLPESDLLDPERPLEPEELLDYFVGPRDRKLAAGQFLKLALLVGAGLVLAALWRWTPLADWLTVERVLQATTWLQKQPLTPLLVPAAYLAGGLVAFPVTLMLLATMALFGPWAGFAYAVFGTQFSALAMFYLGRYLGPELVGRYAGSLVNRLRHRLRKAGLITVVTVRVIPVAPFSVINLVAGLADIKVRDFILGTFIGLLPATIALALLADRLAASLRQPDLFRLSLLLAAIGAVGGGIYALRRWLRGHPPESDED